MTVSAVEALRLAIQNTEVPDAVLGVPADIEAMNWFGSLLGFRWPATYLAVLGKHDGFFLGGASVYSFAQSVNLMMVFREKFRQRSYWPVGGDGCGNYFVLALNEMNQDECPVYFTEGASDWLQGEKSFPSYSHFVNHVCEAASAA
jgi:hypothetical protein